MSTRPVPVATLLLFCLLLPQASCPDETGTRSICLVFADFRGDGNVPLPSWSDQVLDPALPGSFTHYFHTMSLGRLTLTGAVAPRVYESSHDVGEYLADDQESVGEFGRFSLEILRQADAEVDFAAFDNDGPDGRPNSGDDDGVVDALFIVVASAPAHFMYRAATGVANLGFGDLVDAEPRVTEQGYVSDDVGISGSPILIAASQGAVQQGRNLVEAVGSMCHEYGHLLGLPDLYNTGFVAAANGVPADDSAGIGAWGLMGWGALGWAGQYGPSGLSAWSRMRLGWADVVEPSQLVETMELEDVGLRGQVYKIPLSRREYLLLEYRTRSSTYYDRGVPGEGLLVWHVERTEPQVYKPARWIVDLECADGQWADAGYPLGRREQVGGEDNLDFWAHDQDYARAHGGNLGDATDPFDGVRFTDLTASTNPSSASNDGELSIDLGDIAIIDGRVRARVRINPPQVEVRKSSVSHEHVAAGVPVAVAFELENVGGSVATGLRAVLRSDDVALEILDPEIDLQDLEIGAVSLGGTVSAEGYPEVRFRQDLAAPATASVVVEIYAGEMLLDRSTVSLTGTPAHAVEVWVRADTGEPMADVTVAASDRGGFMVIAPSTPTTEQQDASYFRPAVETDSSGCAHLSLPTGVYSLTAQPPADSPWAWVTARDVSVVQDTSIELVAPRAYALLGTIRDSQGHTLHGQGLRAQGIAPTSGYWHTRTAADGTYALKLPAGHYALETYSNVNTGSFNPRQAVGEIVIDGDMTLDINLQAGVQVTIQAQDGAGQDVAGLQFRVASDADGSFWSTGGITGEQGAATVETMPGAHTLSYTGAPAPFLLPESRALDIHADTTIRVSLERGHALVVEFIDEVGAPGLAQSDFSITVQGVSNGFFRFLQYLSPGSLGTLSLGVPDGEYYVGISSYRGSVPAQGIGPFVVPADTSVQFVVRSGVRVSGRLQTDGGQDPGSGQLTWRRAGEDDLAGGYNYSVLNPDGGYQLALLPGRYSVSASFWEGQLPSQRLDTVTVRQDTVMNWTVRTGRRIVGLLLALDGAPGGGMSLQAYDADTGVSGSGAVGVDGVFAMNLPDGEYAVSASVYTNEAQRSWRLGHLRIPAPTDTVRFTAPGGAELRLRLTDAAGQALRSLIYVFAAPLAQPDVAQGDYGATSYLRSPGAHHLPLHPGHYAVLAQSLASDFTLAHTAYAVEELIVIGETTVDLVLDTTAPLFEIRGQITGAVGAEGKALALHFYDRDQGLLLRASAARGQYETQLPRGRYQIAAWPQGEEEPSWLFTSAALTVTGDLTHDILLDGPTAVTDQQATVPGVTALWPNCPNPFNASTSIVFQLAQAGVVQLEVFNVAGQLLRVLASDHRVAGLHRVVWEGRDDAGREVGSGVYITRLRSGTPSATCRMLLMK